MPNTPCYVKVTQQQKRHPEVPDIPIILTIQSVGDKSPWMSVQVSRKALLEALNASDGPWYATQGISSHVTLNAELVKTS